MVSIDDRISELLRSKTGIEKKEIRDTLIREGYDEKDIALLDWAIL